MSTTDKTINSYDKFAQEYTNHLTSDDNFWNKYLEAPAMESILSTIVNNKKVLDLGCGSGISTVKLKKWGANVIGIDISKKMVEIAKKNYKDIDFLVGNIENTHFNDNEFDIVASSLVLHYIEDLKKVFTEVYRITNQQGIFVFSMHHPIHDVKEKVKINGEKRYLLTPYFNRNMFEWSMIDKKMVLDSYHHTFSDITNNLIESGFTLKKVVETTPIKEGKKIDEKDYETTMNYPTFIVFVASK